MVDDGHGQRSVSAQSQSLLFKGRGMRCAQSRLLGSSSAVGSASGFCQCHATRPSDSWDPEHNRIMRVSNFSGERTGDSGLEYSAQLAEAIGRFQRPSGVAHWTRLGETLVCLDCHFNRSLGCSGTQPIPDRPFRWMKSLVRHSRRFGLLVGRVLRTTVVAP